jgi:hypothetical protein
VENYPRVQHARIVNAIQPNKTRIPTGFPLAAVESYDAAIAPAPLGNFCLVGKESVNSSPCQANAHAKNWAFFV